jgi:hypothetical protein
VAADGFFMPNGESKAIFPISSLVVLIRWHAKGITFSPGGKYVYISDTGIWRNGLELSNPSSMLVVPPYTTESCDFL